jgi:hypothetical protein
MALIILLGIAVALFVLSFITKRRFGILGLGLAAGTLLSTYWSSDISHILNRQGVTLSTPPLVVVVATVLLFAPPLLLLASGPIYHKLIPRVVGSAFFALMGSLFLLPVIKSAVVLDASSLQLFAQIENYSHAVIALLIVYAVFDTMFAHGRGLKHSTSHEK